MTPRFLAEAGVVVFARGVAVMADLGEEQRLDGADAASVVALMIAIRKEGVTLPMIRPREQ
jgi:hypothetical protein